MTKPSIYIATPGYSNLVTFDYARSLAETYSLVRGLGCEISHSMFLASSLLCKSRNLLVKDFMNSDATHLLLVDSDIGWPAEAVIGMLRADKDIVVGLYPARAEKAVFFYKPVTREDGSVVTNGNLMQITHAPAGFMLLKKESVQRMMDAFPERRVIPKDKRYQQDEMYVLFNTEVYEQEFWGEDYVFCRLATEAGLEIWADIDIALNHAGKIGCVRDILEPMPDIHPNLDGPEILAKSQITFDILKGKL